MANDDVCMKEHTYVLGRDSGSFRMVMAAWTMAMGVATYPASAGTGERNSI